MKNNQHQKIEKEKAKKGSESKQKMPKEIKQKNAVDSIPVCEEKLNKRCRGAMSVPSYYRDRGFKCVDCGESFVFSAKEQREWYEVKKMLIWQTPIRCSIHYKQWNEKKVIALRLNSGSSEYRNNPESPLAMREYAHAIVAYYNIFNEGKLEEALHLFRKLGDEEDVDKCRQIIIEKKQRAINRESRQIELVQTGIQLADEMVNSLKNVNLDDSNMMDDVLCRYLNKAFDKELEFLAFIDILMVRDIPDKIMIYLKQSIGIFYNIWDHYTNSCKSTEEFWECNKQNIRKGPKHMWDRI